MMAMDRVSAFLRGKRIFVTGVTGFLGQPLVEKILWTAPEVERIHVLIRPKRQFGGEIQSPQERLRREVFGSSVFDRLRHRHGDDLEPFLEEKVVAVAGDISEDGLGIDPDLAESLRESVDVVINSAAVVSFDAPLDQALELNVLGAGRVAAFARSCDHAILLHVSTAYVCGATDAEVPETIHHAAPADLDEPFPTRRFTDPDLDLGHIRALIEEVREEGRSDRVRRELVEALVERRSRRGGRAQPRREVIENLRRKWIDNRLVEVGMEWARERGWNDTYTYTKALGEQTVLRERGDVPTVIVRPAIIESTLAEPSPGWLDGLRMADPLIAAIGKGRLRSLPLDPEVVLDLVPADMVVNAMLASLPRLAEEGGTAVYQVATGSRNPAAMQQLHDLIVRYFQANPMLDRDGEPIRVRPLDFPDPETFRRSFQRKEIPLELAITALEKLVDWGIASSAMQRWKRKASATRAALEKLYYYGELYEPYLNLDCRFRVDRTMELYRWLTPEERRRYNFDVTRLNWRHYMHIHIAGVKKHILKVERAGTLELDDEAAAHEAAVSTIFDLVERTAARFPDRTALQIRRNDRWEGYTYAELRDAAREVGRRFRNLGLAKGDRVVLWSENQPEWGVAYLGAASVGIVVVPLDAQTWHREVWRTARFVEAKAVLASRACFARIPAETMVSNEGLDEPVVWLDVDAEGAPFADPDYPRGTNPEPVPQSAGGETADVAPDDPASIIFTTGTAVDPRGAVHTHRNFLNNLFGISRVLSVNEDDRFLSVLPLYHALEFTGGFLAPLYRGCTVTYARSLKPRAILETMRETGTTLMLGVPTLYALIRDDLERRVLRTGKSPLRSNLMETTKQISRSWERRFSKNIGRQIFARVHHELGGNIRFFVSGGSALGEQLYEDFRAMGITIYEGYGLTETAPVLTVNPLYRSRQGSAGKPLPGVELRLSHTDRDGIGEIIVRSPSLMLGYHRNPEATERVIVDGWFHTGDLGWVDADGYLYITGRIKDVIVTGAGKNVYPTDLEAIYRSLPTIRDIAVVGIPSGLTEEVHALVVPDGEALDGLEGDAAQKAIQVEVSDLARELPSYHRLQRIHLGNEPLPRSNGDLDREAIRREVRERLRRAPRDSRATGPDGAPPKGGDGDAAVVAELARLSRIPAHEIDEETHLYDDLGLDSLLAIELLLFLDHELGIDLDDEAAGQLETVGDLLAEIHAREARPRPAAVPRQRPPIRSALPIESRTPLDRAILDSFRAVLSGLYRGVFDLEVRHADRLPPRGPYLIAANHSSHLDAPAVIAAIRLAGGRDAARRLHVLGARDYFFDTPVKRWFFSTCMNVVPIEREESSLAGLRMVRGILKSGESALIFPEGSRSRSGEIQPFKPGLGLIAWELKIPVVPARIDGTHDMLPPGRTWPRNGSVTVTFGEPITMEAYQGNGVPQDELYRTIATDVRDTIRALG